MATKATAKATAKVTTKQRIASLTKTVDAALKANDGQLRANTLAELIGESDGKQVRHTLRNSIYKRSADEKGNSWLLTREACMLIVEWKANKSDRS